MLSFSIAFVLLVGLRTFDVGADTANYYRVWLYDHDLLAPRSDFLFYFIMAAVRMLFDDYQIFLLVVSAIFYAVNFKSLSLVSKYFNADVLLVFFLFLSLFFSLSTSINVIRQGLSLSFFVLGLCFAPQRRYFYMALCFAVSVGFHMTALMPITIALFVGRFASLNYKWYVALYVLGATLAYANISLLDVAPVLKDILESIGDKRMGYLEQQDYGYETGFRPDFVLFNSLFLAVFLYVRKIANDQYYNSLLKYYCLSSFVFFMAFQMSFSDRFGLFGWFAIAPLLAPVFNKSRKFGLLSVVILSFVLALYVYFILL